MSAQAQSYGCPESDVHFITVVDLCVPLAKASENVQDLCALIQFTNDLGPDRHIGLLEIPEYPKKSSKRGLCDEEREVEECLWSLRQVCDSRWMMPFNVHPSADAQSSRRRAGSIALR